MTLNAEHTPQHSPERMLRSLALSLSLLLAVSANLVQAQAPEVLHGDH